jgi:hypothetical protein
MRISVILAVSHPAAVIDRNVGLQSTDDCDPFGLLIPVRPPPAETSIPVSSQNLIKTDRHVINVLC